MKRTSRPQPEETFKARAVEVYMMIVKLIEENNRRSQTPTLLSNRERQAVELRAKGLLEKEIADQMHVSTSTVKT